MTTSRDVLHDMQLLRDLAIANARTQAELGPLPPGGVPVTPKRKPKPMHVHAPAPTSTHQDSKDEAMKLSHATVVAALGVTGTLAACGSDDTSQATIATEARPSAMPELRNLEGVDLKQEPTTSISANDAARKASRDRAYSQAAYGSSYGIRTAYEQCTTHQPDGTSTASHRQDCADQEFAFQDARLNRVYREVMHVLDAHNESGSLESLQLRDAQREWLSLRDKTCAEAAERAGSVMGPAAQSTCFMEQTAMRAEELERTYKVGTTGN